MNLPRKICNVLGVQNETYNIHPIHIPVHIFKGHDSVVIALIKSKRVLENFKLITFQN